MEIVFFIGIIAVVILQTIFFSLKWQPNQIDTAKLSSEIAQVIKADLQPTLQSNKQDTLETLKVLGDSQLSSMNQINQILQANQKNASNSQQEQIKIFESNFKSNQDELWKALLQQEQQLQNDLKNQMAVLEQRMTNLENSNRTQLENFNSVLNENIKNLRNENSTQLEQVRTLLDDNIKSLRNENSTQLEQVRQSLDANIKGLRNENSTQLEQVRQSLDANIKGLRNENSTQLEQVRQSLDANIKSLRNENNAQLTQVRVSLDENIKNLRNENNAQLEKIRGTVDEQLQTTLEKRISESFKTVGEQLEQVYKGLGEMQNLASDVGGLKKVLSGVKTRGILGEIQLEGILQEILSPEQYDVNVATIPHSTERVEFAVKLPNNDKTVYLPIDSKFPGDTYAKLIEAQESGDKTAIQSAYKALESVIKSEAKDIRDKYVEVPYTTNFGIMFLPFEGLYAEVVNRGLIEVLQRDYQVNIAGPSTMAALLNSLQMGFHTLAIQKRSNEVWQVLGAVKTEFEKFDDLLSKMQGHLDSTSKDLENLRGVRTRQMKRKLSRVQKLDDEQSVKLLELGDDSD